MLLLNKLVRIAYQWVGFRRFVDDVNDRLEKCATREGIKVVEDGPLTIDRSDGEIKLGFIDPASGTPPLSFTEGSCIEITHNEDNEVEIGVDTEVDSTVTQNVVTGFASPFLSVSGTTITLHYKYRVHTVKTNACGLVVESSYGEEQDGTATYSGTVCSEGGGG